MLRALAIAAAAVLAAACARTQIDAVKEVEGTLQVGRAFYPADYPYPGSAYLMLDKRNTESDASVLFRDAGDARAEIGLVADNDFHLKLVTGQYPRERFEDALIVRARSGFVDAMGRLRAYATTGTPMLIVGNSNGRNAGAGVEIEYDHTLMQGNIRAIERDNFHRHLAFGASSFAWHLGERQMGKDPVFEITGRGDAVVHTNLVLAEDPDRPMEAATKAYVDAAIKAAVEAACRAPGDGAELTQPAEGGTVGDGR